MHNLLQLCGITLDELKELYARERSVKRVAEKLGMSRPTVTKWLKKAGVKTLGHRPKGQPTTSMAGEYGVVAKWIKAHPGQKIPRSSDEAAKVIGCSSHAVRNYFYRRSKRVMRYINSFGDLRALDIVLEDRHGRRIKASLMKSYTIHMKNRGYTVVVVATILTSQFICEYPLKKFLTLLRTSTTM